MVAKMLLCLFLTYYIVKHVESAKLQSLPLRKYNNRHNKKKFRSIFRQQVIRCLDVIYHICFNINFYLGYKNVFDKIPKEYLNLYKRGRLVNPRVIQLNLTLPNYRNLTLPYSRYRKTDIHLFLIRILKNYVF